LNEVIQCYTLKLEAQPQYKLNSKEILQAENMKKIQAYVEDVIYVGTIIEDIRQYVNNNKMTKSLIH
jgi:hypothetical protein